MHELFNIFTGLIVVPLCGAFLWYGITIVYEKTIDAVFFMFNGE